ncbi:ferredoxin--NADP reductase [Vibrio methylphosphonaticus]|uniref:ferredoxin--NADP reductase n=1 Tax=Vibrio methylphosphonaticus TaxID=2946866 RepID=UPI002029DD70|nr:ferredoxin--NADP reductase [Vibrio methylphosphonaticus]MCL9774959.1 ferredoxin--NADP reductase [Vibrio methylphosphonaticus]
MQGLPNGLIEGRVLTKKVWTDNLFSLEVSAAIEPYAAGQFTKLALLDEHGGWIRRAYSMVNHPSHGYGHQHLEFLIVADKSGQLSPKLQMLDAGDTLFVGKQASGFMTLDEIPNEARELWMLATGTAVGPFLSILEDDSIASRFDSVTLVHAVRAANELVYPDITSALGEVLGSRFNYLSIVSRQDHEFSLRGRIPALLKNHEIQNKLGIHLDPQRSFVYLCGNPQMVKDTSATLVELGLSKHLRRKPGQFASENYW